MASCFNKPMGIPYMTATLGYGALRKMVYLKDAKVQTCDYSKNELVPMLTATKLFVTAVGSFSAITFWPYYVYNDLCNLEICLTGKNDSDYAWNRPNRHWLDYVLL